jgi:hypothetical protein
MNATEAYLFDLIKGIALKNPDGFTFMFNRSEMRLLKAGVDKGYVCAYASTQGSKGDEGLKAAISHAIAHKGYVGGWLKVATNEYIFDSCMVLSTLGEAIKKMAANSQDAIYCMAEECEVFQSQVADIYVQTGGIGFRFVNWSIGKNKELIFVADGTVFTAQQPTV